MSEMVRAQVAVPEAPASVASTQRDITWDPTSTPRESVPWGLGWEVKGRGAGIFLHVNGSGASEVFLTGHGEAQGLKALGVTGNLFRVLGTAPLDLPRRDMHNPADCVQPQIAVARADDS